MEKMIIILLSTSHITPKGRKAWNEAISPLQITLFACGQVFISRKPYPGFWLVHLFALQTTWFCIERTQMLTSVFTSVFNIHRELSYIPSQLLVTARTSYSYFPDEEMRIREGSDLFKFTEQINGRTRNRMWGFWIPFTGESHLFLKLL